MPTVIHPSAIVDPGAQIGENVKIGPFCVVEDDTVIGDNCTLDSYVQIKSFTSMGKGNAVHSSAVIGGAPQHLAYKGEKTTVEIGDNNIFREFVTIHRGIANGPGRTLIGNECMLMAYVHVAHDCNLSDHVIMANASSLAGHVQVGKHVTIGGMSGIHQFVRIGEYAFLGGMSGFAKDLPPYMLATGVRGVLHGPNSIGLRRHGFNSKTCMAIKKAYRIIFRSGLTREESLEMAESELSSVPEVMNLINFVRSSERGICPADRTPE
ncbi:acyl-ACP--UDP-N-acetylglucosamine O-acyltransferase [Maridesulfovibrio hydrothermalis]|uniref:Acyl-[acyl-carrier-protein]--UDP-N-acetylglucosamine O-acyltransferase n=1 Tax=Maridesulfovibrio hydrothermalis AM13 = DSM 14728 TaxID=1121451 RepID=L0R751_9BACT|nr:acyl-ACP--UDP-N-acetylglucosamine O-acyltransferase [Maridesulfovibrio hydrothermalis]CCO22042.1 Acyl-[acyl-carrier-protein]--UDP-N-acetylglucosamine O-acyltransferase [Maridesulfovibrio hydrothermalis AM13 = DSM 14728]